MAISKQVLDELLGDRDPNEVFSKDRVLDDLKKALAERILNSGLDAHLEKEHGSGNVNRRNGSSPKALSAFEDSEWGRKYPPIAQSWRRAWENLIPFFAFPEAVRRIIYTTDEIDKTFPPESFILWRCGRPRGEAWRVGWKRHRPTPMAQRSDHKSGIRGKLR